MWISLSAQPPENLSSRASETGESIFEFEVSACLQTIAVCWRVTTTGGVAVMCGDMMKHGSRRIPAVHNTTVGQFQKETRLMRCHSLSPTRITQFTWSAVRRAVQARGPPKSEKPRCGPLEGGPKKSGHGEGRFPWSVSLFFAPSFSVDFLFFGHLLGSSRGAAVVPERHTTHKSKNLPCVYLADSCGRQVAPRHPADEVGRKLRY